MEHGGKSTRIPEAFVRYEEHLSTLPDDALITTIFISDGDDDSKSTINERLSKLKGN